MIDKVNHLKGEVDSRRREYDGHVELMAKSASEKSNELLLHMMLGILSVSVLINRTGLRESGIVATAIPVTLALTLAVYLYGTR